jgi:UDP-N-acetylmuramate dehydrogenase
MNFEQELQKSNIAFLRDEPMSKHTSFHIGGPARYFVMPADEAQLCALLSLVTSCSLRVLLLGRGSNLLVSDDGFDGVVISMGGLQQVTVSDGGILYAQGGASLRCIANAAADASLTGLEFAHGIPGTLGGAVRMNAGAYSGEMSQIVRFARCYNLALGVVEEFDREQLVFAHRQSLLSERSELVLLSATMQLEQGEQASIRGRMAELKAKRLSSQPLEYPSAGSVFKRPEGYFAGKLIEDCALKGYTVGGAQVSEKHAGFIINRGGATAADVLALIEHIQKTVYMNFGVILEREIIVV